MNYADQQQFLTRSRIWSTVVVLLLIVAAAFCVLSAISVPNRVLAIFALVTAALLASFFYTPDYLTLTVVADKWLRWQVRIRWRIAGAALILGMALASHFPEAIVVLAATLWLVCTNIIGKKILRPDSPRIYFLATDFILLATPLLTGQMSPLIGTLLLAAACHVALVVCQKHLPYWAIAIPFTSTLLLMLSAPRGGASQQFWAAAIAFIWITSIGTAGFVHRANGRNNLNINTAMRELTDFTGYSRECVWELWTTSNQQLAKNWKAANLDEKDRHRIAAWYRDNSELYLFAISAYNLEYKRILSSLKVLRYARGSCLDYGAGNGELLLELARRGHAATYFDVEGQTMRFAKARAQQRGLTMTFAHTKENLAAATRINGFDTIFSFDVLEHIPDLAAELDFLSSLLNAGGLFVFDVPAGTTRSHPMHLNHHVDVNAHMKEIGMSAVKGSPLGFLFKKQEKYIFTKVG